MCEFCTKHADGKRWYLEAKNYNDDLVSDYRRQKILRKVAGAIFSEDALDSLKSDFASLEKLTALPRPLRSMVSWYVTRRLKRDHFGQVVPIEDIAQVMTIVNSIVRLPCVCRRTVRGTDDYYCLGVSLKPDLGRMHQTIRESYPAGPDIDSFEHLTPEQALGLMRDWETEGAVHTVWTFGTPFIGGICNCDRSDCMAMIMTIGKGVKAMYRAEYVAEVNWDLCNGCRSCMRVCQFGAIAYSAGQQKVSVDPARCYGCGLCRSVCPNDAITLLDRASVPAVANLW